MRNNEECELEIEIGVGSSKISSVTVTNFSVGKILPSNYLMGNSYSQSAYLLINKYSFQEGECGVFTLKNSQEK